MVKNRITKIFLLVLIIFVSHNQDIYGQVNRYMVHLTDKDNTPHSIENPQTFLSSRAIDRRLKQGIVVTEQDLPVNKAYLQGIRDTGADVFFTSKWFNAVLVQCDKGLLPEIEALPFVSSTEYVAPGAKVQTNSQTSSGGKNFSQRSKQNRRSKQEASEIQNSLIGIDALHDSGITGEGMIIAVMDGGFFGVENLEAFQHLYDQNKILYTYDYVAGQSDVYLYSNHGTKVLSLLGAYEEGEFLGTAYDSDYMLFVTEDDCANCEHRVEEYNWVFAAEFADSAGVDVINTSLGYNWFEDPEMSYDQSQMDGKTAIISIANDIAFSKGMLVVASAGNEGNNQWGIVTAPGDALNVISVGNVSQDGVVAPSSSRGPTADGRIKPEVVAMGSLVKVISSSGNIVSGSGTSYSSPQVAGLCALIWQAYPDLTAEDIRYLLLETASNSANPDNLTGYGIPNFNSLNNFLNFSDSEEKFLIYPNPIENNRLVIRVNNPGETPMLNIQIFDLNGQMVFEDDIEFSWKNNTHTMDLFSLSSGIYIFNLNTGTKVEKLRIVKI